MSDTISLAQELVAAQEAVASPEYAERALRIAAIETEATELKAINAAADARFLRAATKVAEIDNDKAYEAGYAAGLAAAASQAVPALAPVQVPVEVPAEVTTVQTEAEIREASDALAEDLNAALADEAPAAEAVEVLVANEVADEAAVSDYDGTVIGL